MESTSNSDIKVIKVRGDANTKKVGSAIARELEASSKVFVRAIGIIAVNQAVKAIAVANGFAGQRGKQIISVFGFEDVFVQDRGKNISSLNIECRLV